MRYTKIIFLFILISFSCSLSAHEIHMKSGKIYTTNTYWERNGEVIIEKYGTTLYFNKNDIEKIVNDEEPKLSAATIRKMKKKYNYNSSNIVLLKNGQKLKAHKTWFEDGYIYCNTQDGIIQLTEDQINKINTPKAKGRPVRVFSVGSGNGGGYSPNINNSRQNVSPAVKRYLQDLQKRRKCCKCRGTGMFSDNGTMRRCFICGGSGYSQYCQH